MNSRSRAVAVVIGGLLAAATYFDNEGRLAADNAGRLAADDAVRLAAQHGAAAGPAPSPAVPLDRAPVFERNADARANVAMRAVYDYCAKFAAFRGGATLEGEYRPRTDSRSFANVRVRLASSETGNGNVLTYQVQFAGGAPNTFSATKPVAAELCGLAGRDVEVALSPRPQPRRSVTRNVGPRTRAN